MTAIYGFQYGSEPYGSGTLVDGFPRAFPIEPLPGEEEVPADTLVRFAMELDIVEPWTIEIDHGGGFELVLTYNGGAVFEPDYAGPHSVVSVASLIYVVVDKAVPFDVFEEVTVKINAQDSEGNDIEVV
jgi:hypothetical protein